MHPEADALFAVPLADFTTARDTLAKRLRSGGAKDAAAEVKKLKKPAMPAWVVNQIARQHGGAIADLVEATRDLREAQRVAVHESDPLPLRAATAAHRGALDAVERAARKVITDAGMTAGTSLLERVRATAHATAVDDEGSLSAGRLVAEARPSGFGLDASAPDLAVPRPRSPKPSVSPSLSPPEPSGGAAEERRRAAEAEREAHEAERKAEAAEREAARLRARAEEAERLAREARARADDAEREATRLRAAVPRGL